LHLSSQLAIREKIFAAHTMSDDALERRITELESRLTFQDDTVAALNDALAHQQQLIHQLHRSLEKLIEQLEESLEQDSDPQIEPPPPHY
jgi:SlyX protein